MKAILVNVTLSILVITAANAQTITVKAEGGEAKFNWDARAQEIQRSGDESQFLYGSGCTEGPSVAKESSALISQGKSTYGSKNLYDWNPRTAWVEGDAEYGIGEYFEVNLPYGGTGVAIFNGYQKNYEAWFNNSRVKKFKVYGDGKPICFLELRDLMGYQTFDLTGDEIFEMYRFEIVEVYPGAKWKDVAISEITNLGCCFNSTAFVLRADEMVDIEKVEDGSFITCIDRETNEVSLKAVLKVSKQQHHKLLRVTCGDHTIELTPYHPLVSKKYGVTSLYHLRKNGVYAAYEHMLNDLELEIWNQNTGACEFQKVSSIELLTGTFETYSIQEIQDATTFIVNGFISTTY
jgi:hypothetical protein